MFPVQQQEDELGIRLYGLSLWGSQSRRFTKPVSYFFSSVFLHVVLFPHHLQTFIFLPHSVMAMCHRNNFKVPLNVNTNKFKFSWFVPRRESSRTDGQGRSLLILKHICIFLILFLKCIYFTLFSHSCFYVRGLLIYWLFNIMMVES